MMDQNSITGLSLTYVTDNGDVGLNLNITCDANVQTLKFDGSSGNTLQYTSAMGCPVFEYDTLTQFLSKYSFLLGAILIVGGLFLAVNGNKFVNFVIGLVGFLASSVILLSLSFYGLTKKNNETEEWVLWVIFVACLLVGAMIGSLLVKAKKIGIAILAGWGGVTLGYILTTSFVVSNTYLYWAVIGVCAIVCFYTAFKIERYVIMVASAFIGSYLFVRGISLYAGGFPTEGSLHGELESGALDWKTFPKTYYAYFAAIIVCTLISLVHQRKHDREEQKKIAALQENNQLLNQQDNLTVEQRKQLLAQHQANGGTNNNNNQVVVAN